MPDFFVLFALNVNKKRFVNKEVKLSNVVKWLMGAMCRKILFHKIFGKLRNLPPQ